MIKPSQFDELLLAVEKLEKELHGVLEPAVENVSRALFRLRGQLLEMKQKNRLAKEQNND